MLTHVGKDTHGRIRSKLGPSIPAGSIRARLIKTVEPDSYLLSGHTTKDRLAAIMVPTSTTTTKRLTAVKDNRIKSRKTHMQKVLTMFQIPKSRYPSF